MAAERVPEPLIKQREGGGVVDAYGATHHSRSPDSVMALVFSALVRTSRK